YLQLPPPSADLLKEHKKAMIAEKGKEILNEVSNQSCRFISPYYG
ncbi:MAG: hypothetical protein ACI9U5_001560, partial [Colwellia sp.]